MDEEPDGKESNPKKYELSLDETSFERTDNEIQQVIQELKGDNTLERFTAAYEKLHKSFKKSHENERQLMQKCLELNTDIVTHGTKVTQLMTLSEEDKSTIASLKQEVEKAWKLLDQNQQKEQDYKRTVESLETDIGNLRRLVQEGECLSLAQEDQSSANVQSVKDAITAEHDEVTMDISSLLAEQSNLTETKQELEAKLEEAQNKILELQQDIQMCKTESQCESRKKDKIEREMKQIEEELENMKNELKSVESQKEKYKTEVTEKKHHLEELKVSLERNVRDNKALETKLHKSEMDYKNQLDIAEQMNHEIVLNLQELKKREEEISNLKRENERITKAKESLTKKVKTLEDSKCEVDKDKDILKTNIGCLERAMEKMKKDAEQDHKTVVSLTKERDLLKKEQLKAVNQRQKDLNQVKLHEQNKKNLEREISNHKDEAQKQRKLIYQLEKERDRYINEASAQTEKVLQLMEDVKMRHQQISDFTKKIAEAETKLKEQQKLYEDVRSDRNLCSKRVIECQDELTEKKRKLKIMNHQIDQLKEEIQSKESGLVQENTARLSVEKEKDALKVELQKMKVKAAETDACINIQEAEKRKLKKIIMDADVERCRQKKELDQVISERDILGTQLVRRNDELRLLFEKIKIQQSTLENGETQYNQRLEDIRILKLEIRKIQKEKMILSKSVGNVNDLRQEVSEAQKKLLMERTRCKALEKELENPLNIHRWRKLKSTDPNMYKMIQRNHDLQKRLIKKTDEVVEKELQIQEKEKLYIELKRILARQPGPEVAEQLSIYQQTFKKKVKQMKAMAAELTMLECQASEDKYEKDKLVRELQEMKTKYYMQKKKEEERKEKESAIAQNRLPPIQPHNQSGPRFTGGGFNLCLRKL